MRRFSALVGRRVETESGLPLGRCHDFRGELSDSRLEVVAMCVGRAGMLDRLGIRSRTHDEIAWSAVVRMDGKRIVVRDP